MTVPIFNNGFDISQATCLINGIPCAESVRDYYEGADRQSGPDLSKTYFCNWADRFTVANSCLGLNTISGGRTGLVSLGIPLQHPQVGAAYCGSLRITGKGRPFAGPYQLAFPVAAIQVGFKSYPWSFQAIDDPEGLQNIDPATSFLYATQSINQGEQSVDFKATSLRYVVGGVSNIPQNGMSIPFNHTIMRITFEQMPYLPVGTAIFQNHTNATTFLGQSKGLVRFKGSDTNRTIQSDGSVSQTVTNTYEYRPWADWNKFPNPNPVGTGNTYVLFTYADGSNIFPYDDLTQTFPDYSLA